MSGKVRSNQDQKIGKYIIIWYRKVKKFKQIQNKLKITEIQGKCGFLEEKWKPKRTEII